MWVALVAKYVALKRIAKGREKNQISCDDIFSVSRLHQTPYLCSYERSNAL